MAISATPDTPRPFGYKIAWLAINGSPHDVVAALGLEDARAANWESGIAAAHDHKLPMAFVTPEIDGWTLVVCARLPEPEVGAKRFQQFAALMEAVGKRFTDVQYFATHRVVEFHAWAHVRDGEMERLFVFLGERGEVIANVGRSTPEEVPFGLSGLDGLDGEAATESLFDALEKDDSLELPNEQWVVDLAGRLSVDPTTLDSRNIAASVGIVGRLPARFCQ